MILLLGSVGLLTIILVCQAALNMWFIMRSTDMARNTAKLETITIEADRQGVERTADLRKRLTDLEVVLASRHDNNLALLEKIILGQKPGLNDK